MTVMDGLNAGREVGWEVGDGHGGWRYAMVSWFWSGTVAAEKVVDNGMLIFFFYF